MTGDTPGEATADATAFDRAGRLVREYDLVVAAFALAMMPPLFFTTGGYYSRLFILFLVFSIFAVALNVAFGHTDQLFLFIGGIAGVSAYGTALLAQHLGVSPWVTLLPSALLAGSIGAVVSYTAARRRVTVIVIAILTLAIQLGIHEVLVGARDITRGTTGFPFSGLGLEVVQNALGAHEHIVLYYLLATLLVGVLAFYRALMNSKYGLAFDLLRQDEIGAEATGIDVVKYKTLAGFCATFIVGIAAPFYVQFETYILPELFAFRVIDVFVLIMLVIGGLRTTYGPVVGAAIILLINEQLADAGPWRTVVFGLMLVVLFLSFRRGVVPYAGDLLDAATGRSDAEEAVEN